MRTYTAAVLNYFTVCLFSPSDLEQERTQYEYTSSYALYIGRRESGKLTESRQRSCILKGQWWLFQGLFMAERAIQSGRWMANVEWRVWGGFKEICFDLNNRRNARCFVQGIYCERERNRMENSCWGGAKFAKCISRWEREAEFSPWW